MRTRTHSILRSLALALAVAVSAAAPSAAVETGDPGRIAELKRTQVRFMMRGAQRRLDRYLASKRAKGRPAPWRPGRATGTGLGRQPAVTNEPPDPGGLAPRPITSAETPARATAIAANQIVNNRATDRDTCRVSPCTGLPWSGQCEVSIAASGRRLVAAWNDGEGFVAGPSTQGFGYSTDNGTTWIDGGIPPLGGGVIEWTSDPVVAVNEKTGAFYYSALCNLAGSANGVAVVKGTFSGGTFAWGTPRIVVSGSNSSFIYDKEWLVADSLTGNLYVAYSRFAVSGGNLISNEIQFSRNTGDNTIGWSAPLKLSAPGDDGRVQGVRLAVGPDGAVHATWHAIGTGSEDFLRYRRGTNNATIWSSPVNAASLYTNFGTGAPGFNRGQGFAFPGLAVDRGPLNPGRAYVCWNESVNFFDDPIGDIGTTNESETNDTPATADAFTLGQSLVGAIASGNDLDYWSFSGNQGETIICELDSIFTTTLNASFRLFCSDGTTRLGFSETGSGGGDFASGLIVFTLPSTGTYYLRVAPFAGTGGYRIRTGLDGGGPERGRDHRDVFVVSSVDGTTWGAPVRVNTEAATFDDWLPEVAVRRDGTVHVQWYDWRDAPAGICGGASMTYLARSTNGGTVWTGEAPVSTSLSHWTTAYSDIIPNEGDYTSLFANQYALYACWSDGRNNDPDVFMSVEDLACTPVAVAVQSVSAGPGNVRVIWKPAESANLVATVYRSLDSLAWQARGEIASAGVQFLFDDATVTEGTRYYYRLGLQDPCGETLAGAVGVDVPATPPALAIGAVQPNPADQEIRVSFFLPTAAPATLELLDVAGRRLRDQTVTGAGPHTVDAAAGAPVPTGIYMVRLTQSGRSLVARVSVVR